MRLPLVVKRRPHTGHTKGLSPVWERRCIYEELSIPITLLQYLDLCRQSASPLSSISTGETLWGFPLPLLDGSKAAMEKGLWKRTEPGA